MKRKRWVAATTLFAAALSVLGMAAPGVVAAATSPTPLDTSLGGNCVWNYGAAAGAQFKLVWRDVYGDLVARRNVTADENGTWSVCVAGAKLSPGDSLKATSDTGTNDLQIPFLTIEVNRKPDFLSGRGPAGDSLRLHCDFSNGFEPCSWGDDVRIGPNGYWSAEIKFDINGGEPFHAVWRSADDDRVYAFAQAPFVTAEIGSAAVSGALDPGATRTIFLYDSSMIRKGKAVVTGNVNGTTDNGSFSSTFRDSSGNPVNVMPGDTIDATRLASDSTIVVPAITATATASNDRVTGACEETASSAGYAHVYLYRTGRLRGLARYQGDGTGGAFSFNFRRLGPFDNEANVKPGDRVVIHCIQDGGDEVLLTIFAS